MQRRKFIRNTLAAGTGLVITPNLSTTTLASFPPISPGLPATGKKIIVAGAGITGLCCAYELMKSGNDVTVLEASGRYGGHVFTGRDGLSDGLYADFGADHITRPGYEKFFEYIDEFKLTAIPYPNAEGSDAAYDKDKLQMIGGKFYTSEQLRDPAVLKGLGFNEREVQYLSTGAFYGLADLYIRHYVDKFTDPYQPFGVGYDDFDHLPIADIYKKEGASATALRFMGGRNTNALYSLWRHALMYSRGIPISEGETFHVKDGNEQLPIAFAKRLGHRLRLNHPVTAIQHTPQGVTVTCRPYNSREEQLSADALAVCITLPIFRTIPVTPALSAAKQYVVDNLPYSSHPFYVFEAASKFWLDDGIPSINMEFEHPDISSIWLETNQVDSDRIILKAFGPGGLSPQRVLAAFRQVYPGKKDTIEQALTLDWTKDKYAPACEMEPFPIGEMHKFWPEIMRPEGRLYFAGTYADNMSRGMESCIRSAQRIAREISALLIILTFSLLAIGAAAPSPPDHLRTVHTQTNHPPAVKIESPANNATISAGASVNYQLQVTDQEDGDTRYDEINTKEVLLEVAQLKPGAKIPAASASPLPGADSALRIMGTNNCFNCHQFNAKSLGPSFFDIAKRYPATAVNTDTLINRVRNGSSGIWPGTEKMPAHPELSAAAIRSTVRWILHSAARPDHTWYFGTAGLIHFNESGTYILTAIYTDHGTKDRPADRLTGTDRIVVTVK